MESRILGLLKENARLSVAEIAAMTGLNIVDVENTIKRMEEQGIICGYTVILNESEYEEEKVNAVIEVKVTPNREGGFDKVARRIAKYPEVVDLSLVSGSFDLLLTIKGSSLQEVASFVSEKLASIEGVLSTSTSFMLKKYKQSGRVMHDEDNYERLKVCP